VHRQARLVDSAGASAATRRPSSRARRVSSPIRRTSSRQFRTCAVCSRPARRHAIRSTRAQNRLRWHLHELEPELKLPAGALDRRAWLPFADEILAMVEQQPDLARAALEQRDWQLGLAQRSPRDRERVDRVRLAPLTSAAAGAGHQLRRHPHDPLARSEQEALGRARHVPAVLERSQPLRGRERAQASSCS
jgi:hypothetical protein